MAEPVTLSALQHYAFCPRQCALIHIEQVWAENWLTASGQQLHQRVDRVEPERRGHQFFERAVLVSAPKLGLTGKLDLLIVDQKTHTVTPVEYKRGKAKPTPCDAIQLCAQALCLEEMLNISITEGFLWYWQTRKREKVDFNQNLREQTYATVDAVKQLFSTGITPKKVAPAAQCKSCSLYQLCQPQLLRNDTTQAYCSNLFNSVKMEQTDA